MGIQPVDHTCEECGKVLGESGFERDEEDNLVPLYTCKNGKCRLKGNQTRRLPTTLNEVEE